MRAHEFRATIAPYNVFPDAQSLAGQYSFEIPSFISPLRSWMGRSPAEYADRILELDGTIEIVVHPGTANDPTFPATVEYGAQPREEERVYLTHLMEEIQNATI